MNIYEGFEWEYFVGYVSCSINIVNDWYDDACTLAVAETHKAREQKLQCRIRGIMRYMECQKV